MIGTFSPLSTVSHRIVVGVAEAAVSSDSHTVLSTYALGSCVGVVAYDPPVKSGGILHIMLPESAISAQRALEHPAMFADTGLPQFFRSLLGIGAVHSRLRLFLAGGASVLSGHDPFQIGERNIRATMAYLTLHHYVVAHAELGGSINRTVHLDLSTGIVSFKTPTQNGQLCLAK